MSKEVNSIQFAEDKAEEDESIPTQAELAAQVKALTELVASLSTGAPAQEPEERQLSGAEKICLEFEMGYSPEDLKRAEDWVLRQMGGRLKVATNPDESKSIVFQKLVVEQKHRDSGLTTLPDGWTITISVPVYALSRYYLPIILDDVSYQSDSEKLLALYEDCWERQTHPNEMQMLFVGDFLHGKKVPASAELKPIRRKRRK